MKAWLTTIAVVLMSFLRVENARAHRLEGLLQATLVEVLPTHVGIEVTLTPGVDIAPRLIALLDANRDGELSAIESSVWAETFMAGQTVTLDSRVLPLWVQRVRVSPLAEMTNGHAEIVVSFQADPGEVKVGRHTLECVNHYEPIPSTYQCNGLVPKAPGVQINGHQRDERQRELLLKAEFSDSKKAVDSPLPSMGLETPRQDRSVPWFVGLSTAGASLAMIAVGWRRFQRR